MVVHLGEQVIVIVIVIVIVVVIVHLGEQGGSVLDLGSGPSISSIIAASRFLLIYYQFY